jgi:hypothetical protein
MERERTAGKSSRGFFKAVLWGIGLIGVLIAAIYFRGRLGQALVWTGRTFGQWLTDWVPAHPGQAGAISGFAVLSLILNWFSHVRGRLRAWIFALVVEAGLWLLFWYGLIIPSFNELIGLNIEQMPLRDVVLFGVIVIGLSGVIFWFLELREEWRKSKKPAG